MFSPNRQAVFGLLFALLAFLSTVSASALPLGLQLDKRVAATCTQSNVAAVTKILSKFPAPASSICSKLLKYTPGATATATATVTVTMPVRFVSTTTVIKNEGTSTVVQSTTTTTTEGATTTTTASTTTTIATTVTTSTAVTTTQTSTTTSVTSTCVSSLFF